MTDRRDNTDQARDCWTCEPRPVPFPRAYPVCADELLTIGPNIVLGSE